MEYITLSDKVMLCLADTGTERIKKRSDIRVDPASIYCVCVRNI